LFARLASGDRAALPQAFRILHPMIQRFCEKLLGRGSDADDATQQSLECVFEQIGAYDVTRPALPWVYAIASWEVKTIRRRTWRSDERKASVSDDDLTGEIQDPETAAMSKQFLAAVMELIDTLPAMDRQTLRETLERELAAESTSPSDAAFRKRKERALQKIRALLRNLGYVQ
jgi:RNA polymerase sigma factor (sigma-70 family)